MKKPFRLLTLILLVASGLNTGCKDTTAPVEPVSEPMTEPVVETTQVTADRDPALNPLDVGSKFSQVWGDTLNLSMYTMTMKPGDSIGLHQHLDHTVYVLEGGTLLVYINGTDPVEFALETGTGFISGPLSDSAVNIGDTDVTILTTEVWRPRGE